MKKISLLFLALVSITFFSCSDDNEALDPVLAGQTGNNNGNGGNNGTGGSGSFGNGGTSSGDYWPATVGNYWQFEQNGVTQNPMEMIGTNTFNGGTYYKFDAIFGAGFSTTGVVSESWLNKSGGNYIIKIGDINVDLGGITGTVTGYEMLVLKDNVAVGESWSFTVNQTITYTGIPSVTQVIDFEGTILEKDVTETVNGETYNNVIKSTLTQSVAISGVPSTTVTNEYWFAKDIGPIKHVSNESGISYESILVDYLIN